MNKLVIKGTILGLSLDQVLNDFSMFVSTSLIVMENWEDHIFDFSKQFRNPLPDIAKKRYGETRQAIVALSNDIHFLSICYHQFKHAQHDTSINNRLKALYFTNLTESYFTNLRTIYDRLAHFPRIVLTDEYLSKRSPNPDSFNDLVSFCKNSEVAPKAFPESLRDTIIVMDANLQAIRKIRDAIIHDGKEPVITFENDGAVTIKIPGKIGQFNSENLLPDILHLGENPYPLFDYLKSMTISTFEDMELLGNVLMELYYNKMVEKKQFHIFGLTGYCMEDFMRFLFPKNNKDYLDYYKSLMLKETIEEVKDADG
ncbi:MAG TPA: hypothetical protein VFE53_08605 [Mucilaginibacter sp.]|nr:hypothetical protein [Mucilaginibacter sp.]